MILSKKKSKIFILYIINSKGDRDSQSSLCICCLHMIKLKIRNIRKLVQFVPNSVLKTNQNGKYIRKPRVKRFYEKDKIDAQLS